jgi:hypothetical protein
LFEIGNTLREARLRRGLDISACESETKIRAKYLRAMEEEQFDILPAPTYVRGFLRAYADFLDLDGKLVLDEYEDRFGVPRDPFADEPSRPPPRGGRGGGGRGRRPRRRTEAQLLWLAIGGVLAVALLVWLGVGGGGTRPTAIPTALPSTTPSNPAASATAPARPARRPRAVAPQGFVVTLVGTGRIGSWIEVRGRGETGKRVFEGILAPGQTYTAPRVPNRLWVRSANPAELQVQVNGKAVALDASSPPTNYGITRRGAQVLG